MTDVEDLAIGEDSGDAGGTGAGCDISGGDDGAEGAGPRSGHTRSKRSFGCGGSACACGAGRGILRSGARGGAIR